nr:MAG TPA: hypothetical protein [Microviridae sp.]
MRNSNPLGARFQSHRGAQGLGRNFIAVSGGFAFRRLYRCGVFIELILTLC